MTKKRANGLQRAAVAKMHHEDFKAQLDHPEENFVLNRRFGSKLHEIYGIEVQTNLQIFTPHTLHRYSYTLTLINH